MEAVRLREDSYNRGIKVTVTGQEPWCLFFCYACWGLGITSQTTRTPISSDRHSLLSIHTPQDWSTRAMVQIQKLKCAPPPPPVKILQGLFFNLCLFLFLRFTYFMYMITLSLSSHTPVEGMGSHYRWLWATMWLLGIELRTSGRAVSSLIPWAISPAPPTGLFKPEIYKQLCQVIPPIRI